MKRVLGKAAGWGMFLLFALIATNGAISYYYLRQIGPDASLDSATRQELAHNATISVINATAGALLLLGMVYVLVRRDLGARIRAAELAEVNEIRFHRLVQMDAMGLLFFEVDGRVTDASDTFLKMIGYPREDLVAGRINWRSLTPPAHDPADQVALADLARRGIATPYEKEFINKDGRLVPVLVGCARLKTDSDSCICYAIDLRESKATQARIQQLNRELQDRVNELETLFELAPVGIGLASDPECRRITVNGSLAAMFAVLPDANASLTAPAGERPTEFQLLLDGKPIPPEALPMQRAAATGESIVDQEFEIRQASGKSLRVLCSIAPLFDEQGRSRGCIGAFTDITERKRLEESLQAHAKNLQNQQHWLKALLDLLPTPLLLIEPGDATVTFANRAAHEMAGGRLPLDLPGERFAEVYDFRDQRGRPLAPEDFPAVRAAKGEHLDGVEINWRISGVPHTMMISADTLPPMHGHEAVAVMLFNDITHLKEIEKELVRNNQAKDAMLTMLGHELRNPLAALVGAGELISIHRPEETIYQQSLTILRRQVDHLARLVDSMLDLAELMSGRANLRLAPLDLAEPLRAAVAAVEPLVRRRNHQLRVEAPSGELFVAGNPGRLEQVFVNLLTNAAKYTAPGGRIDLVAAAENDRVKVRVRDSGVGLDASRIANLFDLFAQVDPKLDRSDAGLGIGLTLVRSLVKLHGGAITASSEGPEKGSEFVVDLPRAAAVVPRAEEANGTKPAPPQSLNVLIVEDQPDIGRIMQALLTRYGHHPFWAPSAIEGYELAAQTPPDVAFVDIGLPGMNGYEFARKMRAERRFDETMLIALTGYGQKEDRERSMQAGFSHHLVKPIDAATLARMLDECGRRREQRA